MSCSGEETGTVTATASESRWAWLGMPADIPRLVIGSSSPPTTTTAMFSCRTGLRALRTPNAFVGPVRAHGHIRAYRQYRFGGQRPQYQRFQTASNFFMRWAAKPTFYRDVGLLSVGAGGVYVWNLEEVPVVASPIQIEG